MFTSTITVSLDRYPNVSVKKDTLLSRSDPLMDASKVSGIVDAGNSAKNVVHFARVLKILLSSVDHHLQAG